MQSRKPLILFLGLLAVALFAMGCGDGDGGTTTTSTPPDQPDECVDNDGDGFGNPASDLCEYPNLDCDDDASDDPEGCGDCNCFLEECAACAACIHPAGRDYPGDDVDTDCDPATDVNWNLAPSAMINTHRPHSTTMNYLALLLAPAAAILLLKIRRRRK